MSRHPLTSIACALLLIAMLPVTAAEPAQSEAPAGAGGQSLQEMVEQGRLALVADKFEDAQARLQEVMSAPAFKTAEPGLQYFTFLLSSYAAGELGDHLSAHEFLMTATQYPQADADDWIRRAFIASRLDKWEDAGLSLTSAVARWPDALGKRESHGDLVNMVVGELRKRPALREQRLDLLNALFAANYKTPLGFEPSYLWLMLASDALDRHDLKRARSVARRIDHPSTLVAMVIDRRFDSLTTADPALFDVRTAAERHERQLREAVRKSPKSLAPVVQHGYALYTLGRFKEMLALAEDVIRRVEKSRDPGKLYDDLDANLNWIHNHKASALHALGRHGAAAATLAAWEKNARNRSDKASQAINLGFVYNELGQPENALAAVGTVDWVNGVSPYGRTQFQFVRFQAFRQLGRMAEADEVITWMRNHEGDAPQTLQNTLLEAGDADGAAAMLISRLRNPDQRAYALAEVQTYAAVPRTKRQQELDALREAFLARADVAAAIAEVGRRQTFPIHSMEY